MLRGLRDGRGVLGLLGAALREMPIDGHDHARRAHA